MCHELSKVTAAGLLSQSIEKFLKLRIEGAGPLPKHHVLAHHYQRHGGRVRLQPVGDLPSPFLARDDQHGQPFRYGGEGQDFARGSARQRG